MNQGQRSVPSFPCCFVFVCQDLRRVFLAIRLTVYLREALRSRINPILWHTLLLLLLFALRRWLEQPSSDFFRDPYGFQFGWIQIFPAQHMCIDAPKSTTNSLSFRFGYGWRWETPNLGRWERGSFVLFFELQDTFRHSPRVSAGASLLSLRLFLRPILKIWSVWTALVRDFWTGSHQAMDLLLSRMFAWRSVAFENCTRRLGLKTCVFFCKIGEDFGGSMSWDTQPNCRASFNKATAHVSPFVFRFVAGLIFNLPVHESTFIHEFASRSIYVKIGIREDAKNHKMVSCTYLWCNLCTAFELTSQMDSSLQDSFFSKNFCHPFLSVVQREFSVLVSVLHAFSHRVGNYNHLPSNTVLVLSVDSILLVLSQHHVDPCDSWPLLLF